MQQWSQARDRLERWLWENGCPQATAPTPDNWGASIDPPLNPYFPGNPDDREAPYYGN